VAAEQRDVAVRDDDRALGRRDTGARGERVEAAEDRAAGARHLVLVGDDRVRVALLQVGDHLVPRVADDDDDLAGLDLPRRGQRVAQQAAPGDGMEHLRRPGLHAGALAGGEDDDGGCGRGAPGLAHAGRHDVR
jgi:hypothetical protein